LVLVVYGSFVIEGLVRSGVQNFILVDNDKVSLSNLNRQLIATHNTIGKFKVDVAKERILSINPNCCVQTFPLFLNANNINDILDSSVTYIVDAIDTISSKLELIEYANKFNIPIISSMGTGNKLDATKFEFADIYKTSVCPLAKVIRKELRQRNISKLKALYSKEEPIKIEKITEERKVTPGSVSFVPSVAGLLISGEVIKDIIK